jgi:hypothetical protein
MDPVIGAVVIAGLKYVGKPSAELVKDFLGKILAPTGDAVGQAMAHPIVEWQKLRVERANKLVIRAAQIVSDMGAEAHAVPGRLLFPLLERGSLEEDDALAERWAALLANSAMHNDIVLPAFVSILAELTSAEAKILDHVHKTSLELRKYQLPDKDEEYYRQRDALRQKLWISRLEKDLNVPRASVLCANLQRLGLVVVHLGGGAAELTLLGEAFVAACQPIPAAVRSRPSSSPATTPQSDSAE